MDAKRTTHPYPAFEPLYEGAWESPIDMEFDLPDYCPDVQKILKCRVAPELSSYGVCEGELRCQGVCDIRVLYLDARGDTLRCCQFTKEFSAAVKVKPREEPAVAWVRAQVEHLTCRAVNARRLDLHLAVALRALAVCQRPIPLTSALEAPGLEQKAVCREASQAVGALSHSFTVEDRITLKNGKPPIEEILGKTALCRINSCKAAEGQLALSGRGEVSFLYRSALDGGLEKMSASLEFGQTLECPGALEDCLCDLRLEAGECVLRPREDDVGENTSVDVSLRVFVTAFLYRPCQVQLVEDAYSLLGPVELAWESVSLTHAKRLVTESLKKKCLLSVAEEELRKVEDLWCEQEDVRAVWEQGKLQYRARVAVCLLYRGASGRLRYAERAFENTFTTDLEDLGPCGKTDTVSSTEIWEYRLQEKNGVEVSLETWASTLLYSREQVRAVSSATQEEAQKPREPGLSVYYAGAGEKLWDIAKSHGVSLSDLREQNELAGETLPEARPLLLRRR